MVNLLLDMSENTGLAILFIGHHLPLIDVVARRKIVMPEGGIVESLEEDEALGAAHHRDTRALLDAVPSLDHLSSGWMSIAKPDPLQKGRP